MFVVANENIGVITEENFSQEVEQSDQLVMIDFWAEWCGPCKVLAPIVDELANDYAGKIRVGKLNVDEQSNLSRQFRVMSIPTVIFFKNGVEVDRMIGARGKEEFVEKIDSLL